MSDPSHAHSDRNKIRRQAQALCRQFSQWEGRQPRILVGRSKGISELVLHGICNNLADMGFNVDVAPERSSSEALSTQCVENDADILLIVLEDKIRPLELKLLHNSVVSVKPDTILSLVLSTSLSQKDASVLKDLFCVFSETSETHQLGLTLMKLLFENDQKLQ